MTEQEREQEDAAVPAAGGDADVTVTGARARRSTQKFGFDSNVKDEEEEEFKPPVGPGVKLRDMEVVAEKISHMGKKDAETIKSLYSIMYGRRFQLKNIRTIKDHILDFTGIPDADDKIRQQLMGKTGKWMRGYIQDIMDLLGVDRSKKSFDEENKPFDKDSLLNRLIDWLFNPQETANAKRKSATAGTKKKKPTSKKAAASTKATTGSKRKSATTPKQTAKKAKTVSKKSALVDEDDEDDATESELDNVDGGEDSDSDFDGNDDVQSKKKPSRKPAAHRGKKAAVTETNSDDKNEDPTVPSELEEAVQNKVKDIIANGDAEQLTVKKIVRQLSEDLGKDFSSQKSAIKDFVTNLQM